MSAEAARNQHQNCAYLSNVAPRQPYMALCNNLLAGALPPSLQYLPAGIGHRLVGAGCARCYGAALAANPLQRWRARGLVISYAHVTSAACTRALGGMRGDRTINKAVACELGEILAAARNSRRRRLVKKINRKRRRARQFGAQMKRLLK